jgi:hypothetical protein
MLVLVLICLATYAALSFRRAIRSGEASSTALVAEAERITGYRPPKTRWVRPAVATVLAWAGIMVTLTPVSPTLAVWVGGAIVGVGVLAVVNTVPNPTKIDDAEFDRELRELLDQYS